MINLINVKINVQETQHFLWVLTNCDFSAPFDKMWRYPSSEILTGKKQNFWEIILWKENPSELSDEISRRTAYKTFPFQLWLNTMQLLINVIPDRINLLHLVLAVGDHIRSNCITAKNERVFSAQNCIQDAWTRLNKLISALPLWCKTSGISELQFSTLCYPEEKMDVEKRVTDYILWKHKGWWCFHFVDKISCGL